MVLFKTAHRGERTSSILLKEREEEILNAGHGSRKVLKDLEGR